MKLVARMGEREATVAVSRDNGVFDVQIDDRHYRVDAAEVSGGLSLLIDGEQHEAWVGSSAPGSYRVHLKGRCVDLEMLDPLEHLARQSGVGGGLQGALSIRAYMPGRVVALLVEEGDEVSAGQGVLVLEAMKMENEIQAETAGVVRKIHVEAGQAVETGDDLFEIE